MTADLILIQVKAPSCMLLKQCAASHSICPCRHLSVLHSTPFLFVARQMKYNGRVSPTWSSMHYFSIAQHDILDWRERHLYEWQRGNSWSSKARKRWAGSFKVSCYGHHLLYGGAQRGGRVQGVPVTSATPDIHLSPGYSWLESWGFPGREPVWNPLEPPWYFIAL